MPSHYQIRPTQGSLTLRDGKGSANFEVKYLGKHRTETRAIVVPVEQAEQSWFMVASPNPRKMQPGQTQTVNVAVTIPPETPLGRYGLRLNVVSVDNPDEEYDRSPPVTFRVAASRVPTPVPAFPWWKVVVAAVLVILLGFVVWWATTDVRPDPRPTPAPGPIDPDPPTEDPAPNTVGESDRDGAFEVRQTFMGDFDRGREVPTGALDQADFLFQARNDDHHVITARDGVQLTRLHPRDPPTLNQVRSALEARPVEELSAEHLTPGTWVAVRTSEGNFAAFTLEEPVGPSPATLQLRYMFWEDAS